MQTNLESTSHYKIFRTQNLYYLNSLILTSFYLFLTEVFSILFIKFKLVK
jgi:hypothetical protein